jgi:hypothetical protein
LAPTPKLGSQARVAGALFNPMDEAGNVFVGVMMIDAAEMHGLLAAGADHAIAVNDAPNALAKHEAAFRTPHADFHVIDGVVHDIGPSTGPMLRQLD